MLTFASKKAWVTLEAAVGGGCPHLRRRRLFVAQPKAVTQRRLTKALVTGTLHRSFFQSLRSIDGILARCTVLDSGSTSGEHIWIDALLDLYVMLGGADNQ